MRSWCKVKKKSSKKDRPSHPHPKKRPEESGSNWGEKDKGKSTSGDGGYKKPTTGKRKKRIKKRAKKWATWKSPQAKQRDVASGFRGTKR